MQSIPVTRSASARARRPASKSVSVRSLIHQSIDDQSSGASSGDTTLRPLDSAHRFGSAGEAQLRAMLDPSGALGAPGPAFLTSRRFSGPLSELYPEDIIVRPTRQDELLWNEVMEINCGWMSHDAEASGDPQNPSFRTHSAEDLVRDARAVSGRIWAGSYVSFCCRACATSHVSCPAAPLRFAPQDSQPSGTRCLRLRAA